MADITITDQNFDQEVAKSDTPVIVDFWAPWCAPCRIVSPTIDALAEEYTGKLKVGKLNVDDNPQTAAKFGIMSIPTVLFFKNGQPVKSMIGAQAKDSYKRTIDEVLSS